MKSVAYIFFVSLLLAGVVFAQTGPSGIVAPSGAHPTGGVWSVGDKYQLMFVTSSEYDLGNGQEHIEYFNKIVNDVADGSSLPGVADATWYVLGSTIEVDANNNVAISAPVYLLDGTSMFSSNNADFWDATIPVTVNLSEDAVAQSDGQMGRVWTGTKRPGIAQSGKELNARGTDTTTSRWSGGGGGSDWLNNDSSYNESTLRRFFAVSQPMMITNGVVSDVTPPDPTNMSFAVPPQGLTDESVDMYATLAYDLESTPVTYMFSNTVTHQVSGWQTSAYWSNSVGERSVNAYRVKARDAAGNETAWSEELASSPKVYGPDWLTAPTGVNPVTGEAWQIGDFYHILFLTSTETNLVGQHDIDYWNSYVNAVAAGGSISGLSSVTWFVVGSTTNVDARDNSVVTHPVYLFHEKEDIGFRLFATNWIEFWSNSTIRAPVDVTENRQIDAPSAYWGTVWSGTVRPGVGSSGKELDSGGTVKGSRYNAGTSWLNNGSDLNETNNCRFFVLSEPIEIVFPPPPSGMVLIIK